MEISMWVRYGPEQLDNYPLPPFPCLEDTVTERVERHYNPFEWSCPISSYHAGLGPLLRYSNRRLDSSGLVEQCIVFESVERPVNVKDLKKVEMREGTRTKGIGLKEESDDEEAQESNPQDDSSITRLESESHKKHSRAPPVPAFSSESTGAPRLTWLFFQFNGYAPKYIPNRLTNHLIQLGESFYFCVIHSLET